MTDPMLIEYRVKTVTRYIVTRHVSEQNGGSTEQRGEYHNAELAYNVAYALAKDEHERRGWKPGDLRMRYPKLQEESGRARQSGISPGE